MALSLLQPGCGLILAAPWPVFPLHLEHLPVSSKEEKNSSSLWPLLVLKTGRVVIISADRSLKDTDTEESCFRLS